MNVRWTVPLLAVALLTTACASDPVEPPVPTPTVAPSSTPSPTPSPTPGPEVEASDPELGIVFEDVPLGLGGAELEVYNTVAAYQKEYWRMMTTDVVGPGFDVLSSPEVRSMMERIATQNANAGGEVGGTFHSRIGGIVVDGDNGTATVCDDFRDVTVTDADGAYSAAEVGLVSLAKTLTMGPVGNGRWMVLRSTPAGPC